MKLKSGLVWSTCSLLTGFLAPTSAKDAPHVACSTGDPHILTFDGLKYECHGEGDFILLRSKTGREVQAHYEHMAFNKAASIAKAIAIRDGHDSPIVQLSIPFSDSSSGDDPKDLQLFVNKEKRSIDSGSGRSDVKVEKEDDHDVRVTFTKTGFSMKVRFHHGYLSTCASMATPDDSVGVLGTPTGTVKDDWTTLDGLVVPIPTEPIQRYQKPAYDFCTKNFCIKKEAESMITYPEARDGLDFHYYQKCDLPYGSTVEQMMTNVSTAVLDLCRGDLQCVIDVQINGAGAAPAFQSDLDDYSKTCNPVGGECEESKCCEGDCVNYGGLAGKICGGDKQCVPAYGDCTEGTCCTGHTCKKYDDGSQMCVEELGCKPEWTGCGNDSDCCDDMKCLDNQRGSKSCRPLPACAANLDDCTHVSCCGGKTCVDTVDGGRQCMDIPKCWLQTNRDCSLAPCCVGLTCIERDGRSLCKKIAEFADRGTSCMYSKCDENKPLECVDGTDIDGNPDKICEILPAAADIMVFNDLSSNGMRGSYEPGIRDVKIRIVQKNEDGDLVPITKDMTTNGNGWVSFTDLPRYVPLQAQVLNPPPGAIRTKNNRGSNEEIDSDLLSETLSNPFKITDEIVWTGTGLGYRLPIDTDILVFDDINGNGMQDVGERGISGVRLQLTDMDGNRVPDVENGGTAHEELETDKNGRAKFLKVPQGTKYRVKVVKAPEGAVPTTPRVVGSDSTKDSDLRLDHSSFVFTIKSGKHTYNKLDLGFRMPKSVTVRVWNDVNADGIQDVAEVGIEGVKLKLVTDDGNKPLPDSGNGTAHLELTTDDEGIVRFSNVPQGIRLKVKVTKPPPDAKPTFPTRGKDPAKDSNLRNSGYSDRFELNSDNDDYSDTALGYRVSATMVVRVWDDDNHNGIQDDDESGIEDVKLQVVKESDPSVTVSAKKTTNADGYAIFTGLPRTDRLKVKVVNQPIGAKRTRQNAGTDDTKDSDLGLHGLSDTFVLGGRNNFTDIDLGYHMPIDMKVRVWDDANADGIQDPDEKGIEGVKLRLVKDSDNSISLGKCESESILHQAFPDSKCEVCIVKSQKTVNVTCLHEATYLRQGSYKGICYEPMPNGNCEVCEGGKTVEVACNTVASRIANGATSGKCIRRNLASLCTYCDVPTGTTKTTDCDKIEDQLALGNYGGKCLDTLPAECTFEYMTDSDGIVTIPNVPKGENFRVMVANEPNGAKRSPARQGNDETKDSDLEDGGLTKPFNLAKFEGTTFETLGIGYIMPADLAVRVFDDSNGNGIQEDKEIGIMDVEVRLIFENGTHVPNPRNGGNSYKILKTLEDGVATFTRVPTSEKLRVKVVNAPKGAIPTLINRGDDENLDSDLQKDGTSISFNLRSFAGDTVGHIDLGYILPTDTVVRVWNDIDGNGIQDPGEPGIKGVKLRLIDANTGKNLENPGSGATAHEELIADEDGLVTFTGTPKDRPLKVKVTRPPTGAQRTKQGAGTPETDSDLGDNLESRAFYTRSFVGGGPFQGIDLGFLMPKRMVVRVWEDINQNGIQDDDEPGIEDVELQVVDSDTKEPLEPMKTGGNSHEKIRTDYSGRVTFTNIPQARRLRIQVTDPPESAVPTKRGAGNDPLLDSDLGVREITDSFVVPSNTVDFYDAIDLGYVFQICTCVAEKKLFF